MGEQALPKFTTMASTHLSGNKPFTWEQMSGDKGYIAIGWLEQWNLSRRAWPEVERLIEEQSYASSNSVEARDCLRKFLFEIGVGDYVAVNNVQHGLFGIGRITSAYKYEPHKHDCGDGSEYYPHYRDVEWLITEYIPAQDINFNGELRWEPRGTVGRIDGTVPQYIRTLLLSDGRSIGTDMEHEELAIWAVEESRHGTGQGFIVDPRSRRAIETYAMRLARGHYEHQGYAVEEVGKPYDLRCSATAKTLYVEVKGTQTSGSEILLTNNEVMFAEDHEGEMELFVVSNVEVIHTGDHVEARGGEFRVMKWAIDRNRLFPLGFSYCLPGRE